MPIAGGCVSPAIPANLMLLVTRVAAAKLFAAERPGGQRGGCEGVYHAVLYVLFMITRVVYARGWPSQCSARHPHARQLEWPTEDIRSEFHALRLVELETEKDELELLLKTWHEVGLRCSREQVAAGRKAAVPLHLCLRKRPQPPASRRSRLAGTNLRSLCPSLRILRPVEGCLPMGRPKVV